MKKIFALIALLSASAADAQVFSSVPFNLQNGTTADASQVMANFNQIVANGNANAAKNGANSDITGLSGLGSGSAALPSIRFLSAASTGIYYDGTNLGFSVGGVEQAWVPPATAAGPAAVFVAGEVRAYAMSTCPTGWLEANGASLLRAGTYAGLFANIGVAWGSADGAHFNIPDLRGTVARAWDHGRGLDPAAPAFASYEVDQYVSHGHGVSDNHQHTYSFPNSTTILTGSVGVSFNAGSAASFLSSQTSAGSISVLNSGSGETRAKSTIVLYCIKT